MKIEIKVAHDDISRIVMERNGGGSVRVEVFDDSVVDPLIQSTLSKTEVEELFTALKILKELP